MNAIAPDGAAPGATPLAIGLAAALAATAPAFAESSSAVGSDTDRADIVSRGVEADFDDVRLDVESAIMNGGFVIDYHARIGEMLDRTAADVGAEESIYRNAETWQFCSAILSRESMAADPANIAHCPYVVFAYETRADPGTVVVGFRTHANARGDAPGASDEAVASEEALAAVDAALARILDDATR